MLESALRILKKSTPQKNYWKSWRGGGERVLKTNNTPLVLGELWRDVVDTNAIARGGQIMHLHDNGQEEENGSPADKLQGFEHHICFFCFPA